MPTRAEALEHLKQLKQENPAMTRMEALEALKVFKNQGVQEVAQPVQTVPEGVEPQLMPQQEGLASIPFTSANLGQEVTAGGELTHAEDTSKFDLLRTPSAIQAQIAQQSQTPEGLARRKAIAEERVKAKKLRLDKGKETFTDILEDVVVTRDVTLDPNAGGLQALGGFSGILPRLLGMITGKGDIRDESTKLFKGSIEDLNKWSNSREAQNTTADQMIENLRDNLDSVPAGVRGELKAQINKIEESKNSGALTSAVDVIGNLFLEMGSDPTMVLGVTSLTRNAIKKAAGPKTALGIAQKLTGETSGRLSKFGIRNNKMLEFLDAQPGKNVREKLSGIRRRQAGELTPKGEIQPESIEVMFDERTLRQLDQNADALQVELNTLKETQRDVTQRVGEKAAGRKQSAEETRRAGEFDIETTAETGVAKAEKEATDIAEEATARAERQISEIPEAVSSTGVVEEFTKGGKFSGRGTNKAFDEAEKLAGKSKIDVPTRKNLIEEMVASAEGDVDRVMDYTDVVNKIFAINKKAPLADYRKMLKSQDIDPVFAESFRRIKQGTANDIVASKRQFNKALSREGVALDDTIKRSADNFKTEADKVVENTLGVEGYERLISLQEAGGAVSNARKKLLKAMKLDPRKTEVIDDIDFNDAINNLDSFIDDAAKKLSKEGDLQDFADGGRFPAWKKHFGIDVEKEVRNRAKKLGLQAEAEVVATEAVKSAKETIGGINVAKSKAKASLSRSTGDIKKKIDGYVKQSKKQLQKGFSRRSAEIQRALNKAKSEAGAKANVAKDFSDEVKYFANEGGFSKNIDRFKTFESKYGKKLTDMIEDQAIFSTFDVGPTGKINNHAELISQFEGIKLPHKNVRTTIFGESIVNKAFTKLRPFESRLNSVVNSIKSRNKEVARELNRIEKRGGDTKEAFKHLMDRQPLITADALSSEFKVFKPLDFFDKAFLFNVARSTGREYTNKERMAAKRIIQREKLKTANNLGNDQIQGSSGSKGVGEGLSKEYKNARKILTSSQKENPRSVRRAIDILSTIDETYSDFEDAQGLLKAAQKRLDRLGG